MRQPTTLFMNSPPETNDELDFDELVSTYYTPLYRFAYSLAKNEVDAADLTQQTFLIYADKGSSLREKSKVKSWLFTTLYREFLRIRRRGVNMTAQEPEIIEISAGSETPDMTTAIDAGQAVQALEEIDEIFRAPLALFYLEDLSYKEIAEALDVPIGTVMSRLSRGKAQLKEILEEKGNTKPHTQ